MGQMGQPMIPMSIIDVTPRWLTEVLRTSGRLGVDGRAAVIRPERIGDGVGIMGEIHKIALTYEGEADGAPRSVVVKLQSPFEANREQGVSLGMYEAEVRFYRELAHRMMSGPPEVHFATVVPGTADFVIVMEDLTHLTLVSQLDGLNAAQARAAVHVLADIHSSWWDQVQEAELDWIPSMIAPRIVMLDEVLPRLWPVHLERFGDHLPEGGEAIGAFFSSHYLALMRAFSGGAPWTLAHQGFRAENILIGDPDRDEVVVIDWQGLGRGPGAYDLAYLLGGSVAIEVRRQVEHDLVSAYHDRLTAGGVSGYPIDQCRADYSLAQCLGGLATTIFTGGTLDLANERGRDLLATLTQRHFAAAADHGGVEIMQGAVA